MRDEPVHVIDRGRCSHWIVGAHVAAVSLYESPTQQYDSVLGGMRDVDQRWWIVEIVFLGGSRLSISIDTEDEAEQVIGRVLR